jgi:hypothetical protein
MTKVEEICNDPNRGAREKILDLKILQRNLYEKFDVNRWRASREDVQTYILLNNLLFRLEERGRS